MGIAIGIGGICLVVGFVAYVASRPDGFRVVRTADIAASPEAIFPILNNLHEWPRWSPWEKLDANMTRTYGGPDAGVGATMAWKGNKQAGEGNITILESTPNREVVMRLVMLAPFPADNRVTYTLTPLGSGTNVSWAMEGKSNFMFKAFSVFANMDAMVGKDFEEGLANLSRVLGAART